MSEETAKRFNEGKIDLTLLPTEALRREAQVWMMGEEKYGRDNWKKLWGDRTINVCTACALRHILYMLDGHLVDSESGLPHAAHVRCNMAMILEWMKQLPPPAPEKQAEPEKDTASWGFGSIP